MRTKFIFLLFLPFSLIGQSVEGEEGRVKRIVNKIFAENDSISSFIKNREKCESLVYRIMINDIPKAEREKIKKSYEKLQKSMNDYISLFIEDIRKIKTPGSLAEYLSLPKRRRQNYANYYKEAAKDLERFQNEASDALDAEMGVFAMLIDIGLGTFFPAELAASTSIIAKASAILADKIETEKYKNWDQLFK